MNIIFIVTALMLPCPFLKFGQYTEGKYVSVPENKTIIPDFKDIVPNLKELETYLKGFAKNYSYFATLYEIGRSRRRKNEDSLPIYNMVLTSGYSKPIIVFIGGIYASDLSCPSSLVHTFTTWTTNTKILAQLLPLYDYHFIPLVNPEGYEFVYQKRRKGEFFRWLKNMRGFRSGRAVNILNNFDSHFSAFPKQKSDEHYGGDKPFSEDESAIIRDYIREIQNNTAAVFLLFSSPKDDAITYPYAHTMEKHDSWILQEQLAIHAIRTARNISYNSLAVVSTAEYGGLEGGRMDDWLMETLKKSIILNIQLTFSLKASDNRDTLKNLNTKIQTLLKRLVVGSYRDKYLRYQARSTGFHEHIYKFPWKNVIS